MRLVGVQLLQQAVWHIPRFVETLDRMTAHGAGKRFSCYKHNTHGGFFVVRIFKYLKPKEWLMAGVSLIFIISQVWLDLKLPDYMSEITKLVQTPGSEMKDIWLNGGYMLLCALGG
jgi:hypothetical protein